MKMYYVNSFPNAHGDYKVHEQGCSKLDDFLRREFLNLSTSPEAAIKKAQKLYPGAKPCSCCTKQSFSFNKIIHSDYLPHFLVMVLLICLISFGYFL